MVNNLDFRIIFTGDFLQKTIVFVGFSIGSAHRDIHFVAMLNAFTSMVGSIVCHAEGVWRTFFITGGGY